MERNLSDAIFARQSIRDYSSEPVTDEQIERLLDAAIAAPSAGNRQPWFFFVVEDNELRRRLAEAAYGQEFLFEAPVNIVVCADPSVSAGRYGRRGVSLYCIQDTAAAVMNILLAATEMGLGTCWVGAFDEASVASVVGCPDGLRPVAIITVGHSIEKSKRTSRRPKAEVVKYL